MATRIRLQRFGKKNAPFYHVVIADGRAPRDGRFIEKIGYYNPMTNPASINIDFDRALYWVEVGADPSDTVRSLLKREGVYMMKHLKGGVAKGAFSEAEATKRFDAWKQGTDSKLNDIKRETADAARELNKKRLAEETKVREAIAAKVAAKYAEEVKEEVAEEGAEETATEETTEETPATEE